MIEENTIDQKAIDAFRKHLDSRYQPRKPDQLTEEDEKIIYNLLKGAYKWGDSVYGDQYKNSVRMGVIYRKSFNL